MAMTKKEAAELESLRRALLEAKALRFTDPVTRDLPPPGYGGDLTRGWDHNVHNLSVGKACSSSIHHGGGWEGTSAQQPRHLYSTEERAWRAMRREVEDRAAAKLAQIDAAIARLTPAP